MFKKIKALFLDIFFPIECLGCGLPDKWLCEQCFSQLSLNKNFFETIDFFPSYLDGFFIASDWQQKILQKLIHSYKYNFNRELAEILGRLLIIKFKHILTVYSELREVTLLPIPLHKKRKAWRGFNQAELLAEILAENFNVDLRGDLLKRIKNTKPQVGLKSLKRAENISGAFQVMGEARGQTFLLLDDVITTGSTMNECAHVLKQAGADKVYGLAVARG